VQDPRGERLLETEKPLEAADKLVQVLRKHAPDRITTHRAAFMVARHQNKPFLALKAVKLAAHLDCEHPVAHCLLAELLLWLQQREGSLANDTAQAVLDEELASLTGGSLHGSLCISSRDASPLGAGHI
jgi:peptide alpha-N-acetyltransferase